jgi:hypothetical protein
MILFIKEDVRYLPVSFKESKTISGRMTCIEIAKQNKFSSIWNNYAIH